MVTFNELNEQNHQILELSGVLEHLIGERSMCDNAVTAELFFRYVDGVKAHLDLEDKHLYKGLLTNHDAEVVKTAKLFLSGSAEIKRIFSRYLRKWCAHRQMHIRDHANFLADTEEMFHIVFSRIQDETEKLYPLIREVDNQKAA